MDCVRVSGGWENADIMGVLAIGHYVVLFCGSKRREHAWEINRGTQDNVYLCCAAHRANR
jgi:hypothetical protein